MSRKNRQGGIALSALELEFLTVLSIRKFYGLELLRVINQARHTVSRNRLAKGSIYPTLKRLEQAEFLESEYEVAQIDNVPSRLKYYQITPAGEQALIKTYSYLHSLKETT